LPEGQSVEPSGGGRHRAESDAIAEQEFGCYEFVTAPDVWQKHHEERFHASQEQREAAGDGKRALRWRDFPPHHDREDEKAEHPRVQPFRQ
jgi:hypothetical protein